MRAPMAAGTPIDLPRSRSWVRSFAAYRHPVNDNTITQWLSQFDESHRDTAARILDAIEFFDAQRIAAFYRAGLNMMEGWHIDPAQRRGQWRFCGWSTSAGESGDSMLHNFRIANGLAGKAHKDLFIYPSDIVRARLGPDDSLVFVNDFIGTGNEVCAAWAETFAELTANIGRIYLLVALACDVGRAKVADRTSVEVVSGHELTAADNLFADECMHFTEAEKQTLLKYSKRADKRWPMGYGQQGLVVVFQHRCPNNSVALLHAASNHWQPLFLRHE